MGIPGSANLLLAAGEAQAYQLEQSLRFNDDDSAHLSKTSTAGTQTAWTWSCWVKATRFDGTAQAIFGSSPASSLYNDIGFDAGQFRFRQYHSSGGGNSWELKTTARYRDPSAWYHIILRFDSAQSTSSDRVKIWINGAQVTDFATQTYPGQNINSLINSQYEHGIGKLEPTFNYFFDGYLAEMHFVDNDVTLTPADFGEYDDNGVWRPIEVSGITYGSNGFYLKFDPSATNGIGHDHSGNSNNWTPSGFTTSGNYTDVVGDTPTTNYSTINPALPSLWAANISETNTRMSTSSSNGGYAAVLSQTVNPANSFYFEIEAYTNGSNSPSGGTPMAVVFVDADQPAKYSTRTSTWNFAGVHYTKTLDFLGMLWFHFYKNSASGSSQYFYENGTGTSAGTYLTPTSGSCETSGGYSGGSPNYSGVPRTGIYYNASTQEMTLFGADNDGSNAQSAVYDISNWDTDFVKNWAIVFQGQFQSGFFGGGYIRYFASPDQWVISGRPDVSGIAATNLPAPEIADGSQYMNTVTWTGTGASRTIDFGMQPDWIWAKGRNTAANHRMSDNVRGGDGTTFYNLATNQTNNENTDTVINGITSTGVTFKNVNDHPNISSYTYVGWGWKAGGSGSSNTAGGITSTVSASPSSGFSIVSWVGSGNTTDSVGHGLGVTPKLHIIKSRDSSSLNWYIYTTVIDGSHDYFYFDTGAKKNSGIAAPTSTVINLNADIQPSGQDMIAYCFAEVEGYSKFGSYTGSSYSDGPFVYCGFKPRWVMVKRTDASGYDWEIFDSARGSYNVIGPRLWANLSSAETSLARIDFLSNGFKIRDSGGQVNGGTILFVAFAENPFGGSGVSPATAR